VSDRESASKNDPSTELQETSIEVPMPVPAQTPVPASKERSVEPTDALTLYIAELRNYPPISREEEHELAVRWVEEGDVEAARKLAVSNLRLAFKIAMEYRRAWTNVLDLVQESNVGLLEAVQRFDPYKGTKLSTYAAYWIRAYILKYILDNFRIVRLGTTRAQRKLFFRLNKEKRELERQGFDVEPALLAERLDVSEQDVVDMDQRLSQNDLSLNAPTRLEDSKSEVGDFMPAPGASAEEQVGDVELHRVFQEKVRDFADTLDERDRRIIEERVLAEKPRTLQELGVEFEVSRERVRQLEKRLVDRLREYLKENLVDFEYYAPSGD
jgi:RNA polymerase sigma-32 factor